MLGSIRLADRIRLERNWLEKVLVDRLVGELDLLGCSEIAFPQFPCEFLDGFLPGDRTHDKAAVFIYIYRLENIRPSRNEIRSEKEIFMKTKLLRVYEIDLIIIT